MRNFALKKTYENEYLKKIRKELLLVLAKVDENNRSITYLKTTFNIKGKGYTLFPFFHHQINVKNIVWKMQK